MQRVKKKSLKLKTDKVEREHKINVFHRDECLFLENPNFVIHWKNQSSPHNNDTNEISSSAYENCHILIFHLSLHHLNIEH